MSPHIIDSDIANISFKLPLDLGNRKPKITLIKKKE